MLNQQQTVASAVLDHSECAEVFQRHRIDFCCRGAVTIGAAATANGVAIDALLAELDHAVAQRGGPGAGDLRELGTPELVAHIVSTHHEYLRRALPLVRALAAKVSRVHGERNAKLVELVLVVEELARVLLPHLDEEEQSLFPALTARDADRGAVAEQLESMLNDHYAVAKLLIRVRAASDDFLVPAWGCSSYRTLFSELEQLERDVFVHVHLENHILMPRFASGIAQA
jgi:regulator of cell morphogenesis and NO signaling